jgi:glycosyltransferase involved in cell wall biosynthesis
MDDDAAIAGHIEALLADRARAAEMGRRGRERVAATYGVERLVAEIEAVYEELLRV